MIHVTISGKGRTARPRITFSLSGMIAINPGGADIIQLEPGGNFDLFLDESGKEPRLYIRASPNGYYKCHKSNTKLNNLSLVNFLITKMDWPMAENKRKSVWMEITTKVGDCKVNDVTYEGCHQLR